MYFHLKLDKLGPIVRRYLVGQGPHPIVRRYFPVTDAALRLCSSMDKSMVFTVFVPRRPSYYFSGGSAHTTAAHALPPSILVDRLPVEILARIFLLAKGPHIFPATNSFTDSFDLPLRISHVCRFWRQVALQSQQLWTTYEITHKRPAILPLVKLYLERSGNLSLSISVWWHPASDALNETDKNGGHSLYPETVLAFDPILRAHLDVLLRHVHRWQSFQIVHEDWDLLHSYLATFTTLSAPQLTHLLLAHFHVFVEYGGPMQDPVGPLQPIFARDTPPPISQFVVDGLRFSWSQLNGCNLTTLILRDNTSNVSPSFPELLTVLKASPNLCVLGFRVYLHPDPLPETSRPRITLPSLQKLCLGEISVAFAKALLKHIFVPNLRTLEFHLNGDDFDSFIRTLATPYKDYGHSALRSVRGLRVGDFNVGRRTRQHMWHELDNLRVMMTDYTYVSHRDYLPEILEYTRSPPTFKDHQDHPSAVILPSLTTLFLDGPDLKNLKDLIVARREVGYPIRRVLIQAHSVHIDDAESAWLAHNVDLFALFDNRTRCCNCMDLTLERLVQADLAAEEEGVSFLDVLSKIY